MDINIIGMGLKTVGMLLLVLGLLIGVLYGMKRFLYRRTTTDGGLMIKVVSSRHLSPRDRIEVVDVAGRLLVLAVTPGNIRCLARLDGPLENPTTFEKELFARGAS